MTVVISKKGWIIETTNTCYGMLEQGGVAYCDDPRVQIIDHDDQEDEPAEPSAVENGYTGGGACQTGRELGTRPQEVIPAGLGGRTQWQTK